MFANCLLHATREHFSSAQTSLCPSVFTINWQAWGLFCSLHRPVTVIGRGYGAAHQLVDYVIVSDSEIQNIIVSRIHARVVHSGNTYCIHDDSRNGVFINNVKIAGLYEHCIVVIS